ncbi:MAG: MOFRL family protein, partial [Gammaproteobacteria bacterium]|nr:MOFRL family protein [Gammaproteobacteria bacterium]
EEGERIARLLIDELEPGVHIWGGETTVRLPEHPGRGGRNQHLALSAARILSGSTGISLLSAGTDGTDGPGSDAGALVDGGTIQRGLIEDQNAETALLRADSGSFLELSGDLVSTGPTGTNVMDLVIALKS